MFGQGKLPRQRRLSRTICYDVYSLLRRRGVQEFIGTDAYKAHKTKRFRGADNPNIAQNEAFVLSDPETRKTYAEAFAASRAL
jgi:hypothetical protein